MTFIEKATIKFPNFIYTKVDYIHSKTKVTITCPIHGDFHITPNNFLLSTYGCTHCGNIAKGSLNKKTTASFIEEAKARHNNKYTYGKTVYTNAQTKVIITCPIHGDFEQKPYSHLQNRGCDACAREANSISKRVYAQQPEPVMLYYIYIPDYNVWKIGCTKYDVAKRFSKDTINISILHTEVFNDSREAYFVEGWILRHTIDTKYTGDLLISRGNSELRTAEIDINTLINTAKANYEQL